MPEGLLTADGTVTGAVHDDPDRPPEPSAEAPKGWAWQRKDRKWAPRQRGQVLWTGERDDRPADGQGSRPGLDSGFRAGNQADPDPSWLRDDREPDGGDDGRIPFDDVPANVKDDIAGLAGLIGAPVLAILQQADPYCGTILAQSFENIVDATLPLICRSSKIVKYFSDDKSDWLLWGKLAMAFKPFAQAVIQHHILGTVEVIKDEQGHPMAVPRRREQAGHGDHLTPQPQPEFNYAA